MDKRSILTLSAGIVIGFGFAHLFLQETGSPPADNLNHIRNHGASKDKMVDQSTEALAHASSGPDLKLVQNYSDEQNQDEAGPEDQRLATEVRVICLVMTFPANYETKAIHVKNTWGKRCNKLIFMSTTTDEKLGSVALPNVEEGRDWLWAKTKEAFKYVWEHHRDEADWFMKADDDTYVIVENLRYMLNEFDTNNPIYFGCRFKTFVKQGYMSGGAGYVLSKEALRRFIEEGLPDGSKCKQSNSEGEDVEMGVCLEAVGVEAGDARDTLGRFRILPNNPELHLMPGPLQEGDKNWMYYPFSQGMDCCSDSAVSFHYVSPNQMYVLEYFIYHLHLHGLSRNQTGNEELGRDMVNRGVQSNILGTGTVD